MNTVVAVRVNVIVCSIQLHERLSLAKLAYQEEEEQRRKEIAANKEVYMYVFGFTRIFVLVAFLHVSFHFISLNYKEMGPLSQCRLFYRVAMIKLKANIIHLQQNRRQ